MYLHRLLGCAVAAIVALCTRQVAGQTGGGAGPTDKAAAAPPSAVVGDKLVSDRVEFVQSMYAIGPDQAAKLRAALQQLVASDQTYEGQMATTLRRLIIARSLVLKDQNLSAADRQARVATFEQQYHELAAAAPLSLANVVKQAEGVLSQEQITEGRAKMKAKFAERLAAGAEFDVSHIDQYVDGPMPDFVMPQRPFEERRPAPANVASATRTPQVGETVGTVKRATPPPAPAEPKPPRTIQPAPPEPTWVSFIESSSQKYAFSEQQATVAKAILDDCLARATAYRQQHKGDYDAAERITDATEKEAKLRDINRRLDGVYDVLVQRVEALPTMEQVQAVQRGLTPKKPTSVIPAVSPTTPPTGASPTPTPAPPPQPKVLKPAPPEADWGKAVETSVTKYAFSEQQKQIAKVVLDDCRARADAHHQMHKVDYQAAEQVADPQKKTESLRELNRRLDELYDEMTERVDAIPTMEQKQDVEKGRKPRPPSPPSVPQIQTAPAQVKPATPQPTKPDQAKEAPRPLTTQPRS